MAQSPFGVTFAGDTATWSQLNMSGGPILDESYAIAQLAPQPPFQRGGAMSFALASGMQGTIISMTATNLCSDGMRTDQNPLSIRVSDIGQQGAGVGKHQGNPPLFRADMICEYCAKLAIWLARYEVFDDEQE